MRWSTATFIVLAGIDGVACAQSQGEAPALENVIITARRIAEPQWAIPLSIATVTREDIERSGVRDLTDLTEIVPGLAYSYARGQGGVPVLRGMSAFASSTGQNNVATLMDGLYISNAFAVDVSMLDLQAIEVLRGPQNPLVGRNAFAGAILYETAQPTPTLQAGAQIDVGSDAFNRQSAFLSGPLTETLGARLAAGHQGFDGTVHNLADPQHNLGGWEKAAASGTLAWQPTRATTARLSGYWYQTERDATARFPLGDVPPRFNCGLDPATGRYINYCGPMPAPEAVDISPDARGLRTQTALARFEFVHGWAFATLTGLTGFVQTRGNDPPDDWDLSSAGELVPVALASAPDTVIRLQRANVYYTGFPLDDHEWSEELRLAGGSAKFQWLGGLYWADNRSLTHVGYSIDARSLAPGELFLSPWTPTLTPLTVPPLGEIAGRNRIRAAFGSVAYAISSSLNVSAELRWNEEYIFSQTTFAGSPPGAPSSGSWAFTTPRITLAYKWPGELQAYVSTAKGARSGGFNDSTLPSEAEFGAETNWTYEVGFKAGAAERRLHGEMALYFMQWSDLQRDALSLDPTNPVPITRNIGAATVKGVELSLDARPSGWLDLRLDYAFADARFNAGTLDTDIARTCTPQICHLVPAPPSGELVPDVGGNQLPMAPRHSGSVSAMFQGYLPRELRWYLRAGLYGASREFILTDNLNWLAARWSPSARLGLVGRTWEFDLWGLNLTRTLRSGFANVARLDSGGTHFVVDRANGASWGASLICHF